MTRLTAVLRGNGRGLGDLLPRMDIPAGILAGALLGASLLLLGGVPTLLLLLAAVYVVVLVKAPEFPILLLLAYTAQVIPGQFNPYINLMVGHFQVADLILGSLLALLVLRILAEPSFRMLRTPVTLPLLFFCMAVMGGIATAVLLHGVNFSYTTYEARILLYYTAFFAVIGLVRTEKQIKRLVYGIFVIGVLSAVIIITQTLTAGYSTEPLRAFHAGFTPILLTVVALTCILAAERRRPNALLILLVILGLGVGMLTSLGRNIVISSVAAFAILWLLLERTQRGRLLQGVAVLFLFAGIAFLFLRFLQPEAGILQYPAALVQRFTHLFVTDPLSPEETILWRYNETQYAWEQLSQHPLLGIGLKTQYRPTFYKGDPLQSYIHNGYLWLWLKTGLFGLLFFLWMLATFLHRALRNWRSIPSHILRMASLGFAMALTTAVISNLVAPLLVERFNLAFFAVGMGIFEASLALREQERLTPQPQAEDSAPGGGAAARSAAKRGGDS